MELSKQEDESKCFESNRNNNYRQSVSEINDQNDSNEIHNQSNDCLAYCKYCELKLFMNLFTCMPPRTEIKCLTLSDILYDIDLDL